MELIPGLESSEPLPSEADSCGRSLDILAMHITPLYFLVSVLAVSDGSTWRLRPKKPNSKFGDNFHMVPDY